MNYVLITALLAAPLTLTSAHEGHDVPGSIQAQQGGVVKATKSLYLELVQEGNTLRLYPMTHESKPVPLNEVQMDATAQLPRSKATTPVKLTAQESKDPAKSHFTGSFDAKGAHRYKLSVTTQYKGKTETATFQVEP